MVTRAARDGVTLAVHHHRRYSGLTEGLNRMAGEYGLGEATGIVIHGGAAGIVTTGIHHIDWASEFFGDDPVSVVSTATGGKLNPRSESLGLFGGAAIWTHPGDRETAVFFNNHSSVAPSFHVYYRDATIDIDLTLNVVIRSRDPERIVAGAPVARLSPATEVLYSGPIDEIAPVEQATGRILDELEGGSLPTSLASQALAAMGACVGALESGDSGQRVALPIDPDSEIGRRTWPIS
jgi:predicted dehydrogenase